MKPMKKKSRARYRAARNSAQMASFFRSKGQLDGGGAAGAGDEASVGLMASPSRLKDLRRRRSGACWGRVGRRSRRALAGVRLAQQPLREEQGDDGEPADDEDQPQILIRLDHANQRQREEHADRDEEPVQ